MQSGEMKEGLRVTSGTTSELHRDPGASPLALMATERRGTRLKGTAGLRGHHQRQAGAAASLRVVSPPLRVLAGAGLLSTTQLDGCRTEANDA